jgi:hypothetical protein
MARVLRNQVRGAAISSSQRRLTYVRPRGVKGGCGRQADGTAGLPPAPEIPVRFVTYASCQERSCARETSDFIFSYTFAISLGKGGNRAGRSQAAEVIDRADTSRAGTGVAECSAR